jgi:hypothetical protein
MFGPRGNPQARNLFSVLGYLQKRAGLQQVAQVPGEHLHCGIFRSLPEPKAQVAFDVNQDPRPPRQAHCIDQPAVAGPNIIGDLEPVRDLPLEGAPTAGPGPIAPALDHLADFADSGASTRKKGKRTWRKNLVWYQRTVIAG